MSCHCGYNRCTCHSCQVNIQSNCCKCNSKKGLYVKTVNHGDVINKLQGGSVYEAYDRFSVPVCGEEGVLIAKGEILAPPYNTFVYLSKGEEVARLRILGTTVYNGSLENCGSSCGCDDEPVLVNPSDAHKFCGETVTEIRVVNECPDCSSENQLSPGTFLSSGFHFMIQAPACNEAGGTGSPSGDLVLCDKVHGVAVGEEQTIEVSPSTSTLSINDIIQIQDKRFRIVDIPSPTTITIVNDGEGGAIGDVIDGCDCSSVRIFRIAGDDPCNKEAVEFGDAAIVCADGQLKPVVLEENEVLGKKNDVVQGVSIPVDDTPRTTFQGCIVLNPAADPQEYPLIVDDPSGFVLNDIVFFDCDEDKRRFTITDIAGSNFTLKPDFDVTIVESVADDCSNCKLVRTDCCEKLQRCLEVLQPVFDSGSYSNCHEHNDEPNQSPIDVNIPDGENVGFFSYEVDLDNNGNKPEISFTNEKDCTVKVCVDVMIREFHKNITNDADAAIIDNEVQGRYVWNLIDCETKEHVVGMGFTVADSRNRMSIAFPETEGNWLDADLASLYHLGTPSTKICVEVAAGESINWCFKELFAYRRSDSSGVLDLRDDMCYILEWELEAKVTELCC